MTLPCARLSGTSNALGHSRNSVDLGQVMSWHLVTHLRMISNKVHPKANPQSKSWEVLLSPSYRASWRASLCLVLKRSLDTLARGVFASCHGVCPQVWCGAWIQACDCCLQSCAALAESNKFVEAWLHHCLQALARAVCTPSQLH